VTNISEDGGYWIKTIGLRLE